MKNSFRCWNSRSSKFFSALFLSSLLVHGARSVEAATFTVNSTFDAGTGGCTASNSGDGCSLREAIVAANGTTGADSIVFDASVFAAAKTLTLNGTELPTVTTPISISGSNTGVTISGNNASRVFSIATAGSLTLDQLTVTGGLATGSGPGSNGGGISNSGTLILSNSTLYGNAAVYGGAIFNIAGGSGNAVATLSNCTLSGNSASASGGAIFNYATSSGRTQLTLDSCTLAENSATASAGGIYNYGFNGNGPTLNSRNTIWKTGASGANLLNQGGTVLSQGYNLGNDGTSPTNGGFDVQNLDPKSFRWPIMVARQKRTLYWVTVTP